MFQFTPRAVHTLFVLLSVAATVYSLAAQPVFKSCPRSYKKIGCFKDLFRSERTMKDHLINTRDITSKVFKPPLLDWRRSEEAFHGLACLCAKEAASRRYRVFGLQFYGECWTADDAHNRYDMFGEELDPDLCVMASDNVTNPNALEHCDSDSDKECVGGCATNYVYELEPEEPPPLNGIWSVWRPWGPCTKTCGPGVKKRKRTCVNGNCLGCEEQYRKCLLMHCPIDGGFTPWTPGRCSKTCGGGIQSDLRTCTNPLPQFGGRPCVGTVHRTQSCNTFECPVPCHHAVDIGVVLDSTRSVGEDNFKLSEKFTLLLAYALGVSARGTHIGIITYHRKASLKLGFDEIDRQNVTVIEDILNAPNELLFPTYTDRAIELAFNGLFEEGKGERPTKPDVVIVITDGKSYHPITFDMMTPFMEKGVKVIAVGVGNNVVDAELNDIAIGIEGNVYHISEYRELFNRLKDIVAASCLDHQYTGYGK